VLFAPPDLRDAEIVILTSDSATGCAAYRSLGRHAGSYRNPTIGDRSSA
jgi:hypothetical protein